MTEAAVERLGVLLGENRALRFAMEACVECGACADKCPFYLGTEDDKNRPVVRQNLMRKVYRKHFTWSGKLFGSFVGAGDLDIDDWVTYFHQCSECRRCAVFCPFGIDTAEVTRAARDILSHVGLGQKYTDKVLAKALETGNNLGIPLEALGHTIEALEAEMGHGVKIPIDAEEAEVMLVAPSADFFAEPHVEGLMGYAKVFHQAGISWTLSSQALEAANFALFNGDHETMETLTDRIRQAACGRRVVFGECGHAWRVAHNTIAGAEHMLDVTKDLLDRGALTLDKDANAGKVVTFHDSCNMVRASSLKGGAVEVPRALIRAAVPRFVEMPKGTTGVETFCCGGGGGMLGEEIRFKGAKPRMEALRSVVEREGVTHMAAACAICKSQFTEALPRYGFDREMLVGVHQLINAAIRL